MGAINTRIILKVVYCLKSFLSVANARFRQRSDEAEL
jgi:hypothetical protein